jgi:MFS family permease
MFNALGRFQGLNDEMGFIVTHSLADYPLRQAAAALAATAQQLAHVATGEGSNGWIPHTYGIIERYIPSQIKPMRAAHQQHWEINFAAVNWLHVPVALASMLLVLGIIADAIRGRRLDDLALLAATVSFALLGNALVCGVISGPHDRYGARMAWIATFTVLIAAARYLGDADNDEESLSP